MILNDTNIKGFQIDVIDIKELQSIKAYSWVSKYPKSISGLQAFKISELKRYTDLTVTSIYDLQPFAKI